MHVDTALYVRSHPDGHKQSSSTRTGPLVNDIQNQKVSAAERRGMRIPVERGTGYERKTQECIDDVLGASSDTCFLLLGDSKQAHAFFQDIWKHDAQYCLARLAIFCRSVLKQAVIVTHICWAIDVVQEIPYGKLLQVGGHAERQR